jgi:hypothetical protein
VNNGEVVCVDAGFEDRPECENSPHGRFKASDIL